MGARQHASSTRRIGRYEIVQALAQGGMADVLLARTTGIEGFARHVVVKRIRADQAHDPAHIAMFLDEARLAAALHHQNIVQVTDVGQDHGEYFFAMEYVHGEDVRALLTQLHARKEHCPLAHVITIVAAAAAGLHHAHEQRGLDREPLGIVHRDVSPANILLGRDGGVRVADFGIAKCTHNTSETRTGTLKGKVAYMSPEQCLGEDLDRRSDVFSLGIVLWELVTARRLFKADNDFLAMSAIVGGYLLSPSQFRSDVPPALEAIIDRALSQRPSERFATCDDFRLALEALGLHGGTTSLADYLRATFGDRPEPWLVEPEFTLELCVDGDADVDVGADVDADAGASARIPTPSRAVSVAPIPRRRPIRTVLACVGALAAVTTIAVALVLASPAAPPASAALVRGFVDGIAARPAVATPPLVPIARTVEPSAPTAPAKGSDPSAPAPSLNPAPARPVVTRRPTKRATKPAAKPARWNKQLLFPD